MVVVGAVVGLLIMTKLSTLPMGLVFVVLAFKERKWLDRLQLIAIGCATSIVVCGWYLIQNTYRYGSPLALGTSERYLSKVMGLGTWSLTHFPGQVGCCDHAATSVAV